jgi:hypothetical protein
MITDIGRSQGGAAIRSTLSSLPLTPLSAIYENTPRSLDPHIECTIPSLCILLAAEFNLALPPVEMPHPGTQRSHHGAFLLAFPGSELAIGSVWKLRTLRY